MESEHITRARTLSRRLTQSSPAASKAHSATTTSTINQRQSIQEKQREKIKSQTLVAAGTRPSLVANTRGTASATVTSLEVSRCAIRNRACNSSRCKDLENVKRNKKRMAEKCHQLPCSLHLIIKLKTFSSLFSSLFFFL